MSNLKKFNAEVADYKKANPGVTHAEAQQAVKAASASATPSVGEEKGRNSEDEIIARGEAAKAAQMKRAHETALIEVKKVSDRHAGWQSLIDYMPQITQLLSRDAENGGDFVIIVARTSAPQNSVKLSEKIEKLLGADAIVAPVIALSELPNHLKVGGAYEAIIPLKSLALDDATFKLGNLNRDVDVDGFIVSNEYGKALTAHKLEVDAAYKKSVNPYGE